jgi:hypothetical protein
MAEESTTPDPVELTRTLYETMDRDWDFDALAAFVCSRSGHENDSRGPLF